MSWSTLRFGKHEGKTLPQVLFTDPDWFFWACEQPNLFTGALAAEAQDAYKKATHIRIKQQDEGEKLVAEYLIHQPTGKFATGDFVPASREPHSGSSPVFARLPVIDLSIPRRIATYDKTGCRLLLGEVKFHLFGNVKTRMTAARCSDFFDDPTNFDL